MLVGYKSKRPSKTGLHVFVDDRLPSISPSGAATISEVDTTIQGVVFERRVSGEEGDRVFDDGIVQFGDSGGMNHATQSQKVGQTMKEMHP